MKTPNFLKWAGATVLAGALLMACTDATHIRDNKTQDSFTIDVDLKKLIDDPALDNKHKSQKLTEAAEQLFHPETFFLAQEPLNQALKLDPKNKKAQLLNAILQPKMNMQGILGRIEPLVKKDEREYPAYKAQLDSKELNLTNPFDGKPMMNKMNYQPILPIEYLTNAEKLPKISNENELQDFFASQVKVLDETRKFLNRNINAEIELNLSQRWFDQRAKTYGERCTYKLISEFSMHYKITCDKKINFMKVKLDRGDLEALKTFYVGMQIYYIGLSAYNATDLQSHAAKLRTRDTDGSIRKVDLSNRYKMESVINGNSATGTLNDNQMLGKIIGLGKDAMIGSRWLRDNHTTMCKGAQPGMAYTYQSNSVMGSGFLHREGYLFDRGICWEKMIPSKSYKELGKAFDVIDEALKGNVIEVHTHEKVYVNDEWGHSSFHTGKMVKANMKPSVALTNPIKDLRQIQPNKYNACGNAQSLADGTLGGVFVDGDANEYLQKSQQLNRRNGSAPCDINP